MKNSYVQLTACFLLFLLVFQTGNLQAQSRKYISQFSHFQSYFNPGLTGYEGSTLRGFVRNQWSGMEGAPKTYFISAEMDFSEAKGLEDPALMGKNAYSINLMHDTYGAFKETELLVAYASRVRLTSEHQLRLGAGLNYQTIRLDGNALSSEQAGDPLIGQYLGSFSDMQIFDFNIGLALTHKSYYFSYAMHNVNKGRIVSGEEFMDGRPVTYIAQAGFREALSPQVSLILNGFYRNQEGLPDNIEFNLKTLLGNKLWIGGGHRFDYASNLQFGVLFDKFRLGYIYEFPSNRSYLLPGQTHEFALVYHLFGNNEKSTNKEVIIW
ncbi:PorP/SprF family type IX secretion system membrane protein [Cyclobacterium jeungdonense]|uniref:Type IX secretion system membrane protein PorP/SprF n=1 Tax=Cyclobacterium jeungdonense TaxID=708087 RepID=A0ABT8CAE6_9BACT|nr:type IX secretion system membrane protein PorP/SprF [Cyclobacterium jeungdonense]MDN3688651.1 type IX secretion system membrane protein PorP/SprF [Cyclobacterium jeungdonense]